MLLYKNIIHIYKIIKFIYFVLKFKKKILFIKKFSCKITNLNLKIELKIYYKNYNYKQLIF